MAAVSRTVLGDHVNLGAQLCSNPLAGQTLVSRDVVDDLPKEPTQHTVELEPIP